MAQVEFFEKKKVLATPGTFRKEKGFVDLSTYSGGTVDGRNPAPPGMYKTL